MSAILISQVSAIIAGELISTDLNSDFKVSAICTDSRTVFDPDASIFFAIKTDRNDGHRFIPDLVQKGVRAFVVSQNKDELKQYAGCRFIVVRDTLEALQKLAAWHRSTFNIPVVGITGSNGKTIVKEWLFELLQSRVVLRSPKSYNSQIGVPLSVWNLKPEHQIAIFEAGISKPGEMQKLALIISPTVGIITNIGEAHQENFHSKTEKLDRKSTRLNSSHT